MGSCVSQCSSRTVRQTSRTHGQALDTLRDSFGQSHVSVQFDEIDGSRNELQKSKIDGQSSRDLYSPEPLLGDAAVFSVTESRLDGGFSASDIRDQITTEIQALRAQLVRNHALLRYLEEKVTLPQTTPTPEKSKSKVQQMSSLDDRSQKGSNPRIGDHKWRSQTTSHQKWPLSERPRTQSCPLICPEPTILSRSTQTHSEIEFESTTVDITRKPTGREVSTDASGKTNAKMICGQCEFYSFKEDSQSPHFPRHRTNSFLAAVNSSKMNINEKDSSDENLENFVQAVEADASNSNREFLLPRKLPILIEEDNKSDTNGRSMSNSSRRCSSIQTQTLTPDFSDERVPSTKELGLNKQQPQSINIIAQVIQKRTAFSEELPQDGVRYPPPYRITKNFRYRSSENVSKDSYMQKSEFLRWATASESLSGKYEDLKSGMCLKSKTANFGTRHLSLEKQESDTSSCEPGWCTQSPFPSIVKVSSSVPKPSGHPDDSTPALSQKNRVRILDQQKVSHSKGSEKTDIKTSKDEERKTCSTSLKEEKNDKAKSFKLPQRSMRRGSGAGSPTSLTSIPRCPAFDYSEQDEHTEYDITHDKKSGAAHKVAISEEKSNPSPHAKSPDPPTNYSSQKKRECSTSKMLAPEAVENSETESAKGSFEYEPAEVPPATEQHPTIEPIKEAQSTAPESEYVFPSLPDTVLHKLGISNESVSPVESLNAEQLEAKVVTLALGFKADMMTLDGRVSLLKHNRDLAEKDVETEIYQLKASLNTLQLSATDSTTRDMISELQNHVDILCNAIRKISARSETYGAVKQEKRVNRAFSVMLLHAEGLKRMFDREHKELEETKKMLSDTKSAGKDRREGTLEERKKTFKTFGIAVGSLKSLRKPILQISES